MHLFRFRKTPETGLKFVRGKIGDWIQAQTETGNYGTDSELIREALREKQNRVAETKYIRSKLIASEQSGFTDLTRDGILEKPKDELRRNKEL